MHKFAQIALILFTLLHTARADGLALNPPSASHLSLGLSRLPHQRDLLFPDQKYWQHELNLRWNVEWGRWFMDNDITGRTANGRFRYVGWEYETGFRILPGLDVFWHHHSQHAIDWDRPKFPVTDSYGIRITFLGRRP
jgi:hypothetical protein